MIKSPYQKRRCSLQNEFSERKTEQYRKIQKNLRKLEKEQEVLRDEVKIALKNKNVMAINHFSWEIFQNRRKKNGLRDLNYQALNFWKS
jgi:hypothetical protein